MALLLQRNLAFIILFDFPVDSTTKYQSGIVLSTNEADKAGTVFDGSRLLRRQTFKRVAKQPLKLQSRKIKTLSIYLINKTTRRNNENKFDPLLWDNE